jgi:hypothetical protein
MRLGVRVDEARRKTLPAVIPRLKWSKWKENFEAAVALKFAYYNFCKTHGALRMTPLRPLALRRAHGRLRN